jgi:hypothetical protein
LFTGGITKKMVSLNLSFEKADSIPPTSPEKGSQLAKKSVYLPQSSKTVFMNTVKKSRLFPAFLYFEYRLLTFTTIVR